MLLFKNKKIILRIGDDEICVLNNTTAERFEQLRSILHKKYGNSYGLSEIKLEILNID